MSYDYADDESDIEAVAGLEAMGIAEDEELAPYRGMVLDREAASSGPEMRGIFIFIPVATFSERHILHPS
jgi:hypothetical protein